MPSMLHMMRLELRHIWAMPLHGLGVGFYALALYLLLQFGLPPQAASKEMMAILCLVTLIFSVLQLTAPSFREEVREGMVAHWAYGRMSMEWIVTLRWLVYVVVFALPISSLFAMLLTGSIAGSAYMTQTIVIFVTCSSALLAYGLLSAALSEVFSAAQFLAQLLITPYLFSMMIFGADALISQTGQSAAYLYALSLASIPLILWITARIVRLAV